jgi:putative endonuclease
MTGTKHWFVYMLLCDHKTFYLGISDNVRMRFVSHINKQNLSTKKFSELQMVYLEEYENKYEAAKREKQLKGWSHAKKQLLTEGKLGINNCTERVEVILRGLNS